MKVIGETPPSKFNSIEPSSAPKHEIGVTTGLTSNKSAFSISIVLVSAHPLESVIITVEIGNKIEELKNLIDSRLEN